MLEYSIGVVHMPFLRFLATFKCARLTITIIASLFRKSSSFTKCTREISTACVDTKLTGIKATRIISGENIGHSHKVKIPM